MGRHLPVVSDDRPTGESAPPDSAKNPDEPASDAPASEGQALGRMDLPKWNRARVKRKAPQGTEQDAFQGTMKQAGRMAVRRAPWLIIAVVGGAAALAGGLYWHDQRQESAAQATRLLATAAAHRARGQVGDPATQGFPEGRTPPVPMAASQEALDAKVKGALEDLAEEHPDAAANQLAQLVRGAQALEAGDGAAAESAYRDYLAEGPESLAFLAHEGLGLALEAQDKPADALEIYRALAEQGGYYRDMALAHQGRVLEAMGKPKEAVAAYRQYIEAFPLQEPSLARDFVRERLADLDPAAIAPPTPEADAGELGSPVETPVEDEPAPTQEPAPAGDKPAPDQPSGSNEGGAPPQ